VGAANGFIEGSCDTMDGCGVEVVEMVEVDAENGFSDGSCDTMDGCFSSVSLEDDSDKVTVAKTTVVIPSNPYVNTGIPFIE